MSKSPRHSVSQRKTLEGITKSVLKHLSVGKGKVVEGYKIIGGSVSEIIVSISFAGVAEAVKMQFHERSHKKAIREGVIRRAKELTSQTSALAA